MKKNITLEEFLNQSTPHGINNGHPPTSGNERYEWESKLLFSVHNKLNDKCRLLDYGCGTKGALQYNLLKRLELWDQIIGQLGDYSYELEDNIKYIDSLIDDKEKEYTMVYWVFRPQDYGL